MQKELAEYRKELLRPLILEERACLKSELFDYLMEYSKDQEDWLKGREMIFQVLKRNYKNPKAMNCFIFYDIENNKLRVRLAKYILEKGGQRIQKSVYLANISKRIYEEIFETFCELEEVLEEQDSIFMVPIGEYHLAELKMIGKDVDMSFSRSSQYVIFI